SDRFVDRGVVLLDKRIIGLPRYVLTAHLRQQRLSAGLTVGGDLRRRRQASGAAARVSQIDIAIFGAQKAGPASHIGIADEDVSRDPVARGTALTSDNGADR